MMGSGFEGMGWGWMGLGIIPMVLFWGLVIVGIAVVVRWLASGPPRADERAIDILKTRYAKGELTREQFEQMKRELSE